MFFYIVSLVGQGGGGIIPSRRKYQIIYPAPAVTFNLVVYCQSCPQVAYDATPQMQRDLNQSCSDARKFGGDSLSSIGIIDYKDVIATTLTSNMTPHSRVPSGHQRLPLAYSRRDRSYVSRSHCGPQTALYKTNGPLCSKRLFVPLLKAR